MSKDAGDAEVPFLRSLKQRQHVLSIRAA